MPSRKVPNRTKNREALRFTTDDIVRAIEGVEAAGLPVCVVEITLAGSIKISTGSTNEGSTGARKNEAIANSRAEPILTKKQA